MTDLIKPDEIEILVGTRRHPIWHIGKVDTARQQVYIMHSYQRRHSGIDLRVCTFSLALDQGLQDEDWEGMQDVPVVLALGPTLRLVPYNRGTQR